VSNRFSNVKRSRLKAVINSAKVKVLQAFDWVGEVASARENAQVAGEQAGMLLEICGILGMPEEGDDIPSMIKRRLKEADEVTNQLACSFCDGHPEKNKEKPCICGSGHIHDQVGALKTKLDTTVMKLNTLTVFITRLRKGGRIVSSARLSTEIITTARAEGRLWVDDDRLGYVYLPEGIVDDGEVRPLNPNIPRKCNGCSKPLLLENLFFDDGCPCNSGRGINFAPRSCSICRVHNCVKPGHRLMQGTVGSYVATGGGGGGGSPDNSFSDWNKT
jgi:hypothetical protein